MKLANTMMSEASTMYCTYSVDMSASPKYSALNVPAMINSAKAIGIDHKPSNN